MGYQRHPLIQTRGRRVSQGGATCIGAVPCSTGTSTSADGDTPTCRTTQGPDQAPQRHLLVTSTPYRYDRAWAHGRGAWRGRKSEIREGSHGGHTGRAAATRSKRVTTFTQTVQAAMASVPMPMRETHDAGRPARVSCCAGQS